jgi:DNA (cytosine-5)-methyltransferase 1
MRYLDLFSGIGGFALGITEAYNNQPQPEMRRSEEGGDGETRIEREVLHAGLKSPFCGVEPKQQRGEGKVCRGRKGCVINGNSRTNAQQLFSKHYFSEIDKYASSVYKRHFPDAIPLGDIRNIDPKQLGEINLITFGFPCQDLSIAGNRKGLSGSRSGLFFEAIRLIRELKPQIFVFENVKGLFSSGGGRDFVEVLRTVADLRLYECEWQLLNTKWVLPQNRERIYFVGHLAGTGGRKVFPIRGDNEASDGIQGQSITNAIKARYEGRGDGSYVVESEQYAQTRKNSQGYRVRDTKGVSTTLAGQAGGVGAKTGLYAVLTPDREKKRQNGRRMKDDGEEMFTLTGQDKHGVFNGHRIRRLTPLECERLQGFPDGWTEGESDSQRYKMLGNAVSVPIVKMVFDKLLKPTK